MEHQRFHLPQFSEDSAWLPAWLQRDGFSKGNQSLSVEQTPDSQCKELEELRKTMDFTKEPFNDDLNQRRPFPLVLSFESCATTQESQPAKQEFVLHLSVTPNYNFGDSGASLSNSTEPQGRVDSKIFSQTHKVELAEALCPTSMSCDTNDMGCGQIANNNVAYSQHTPCTELYIPESLNLGRNSHCQEEPCNLSTGQDVDKHKCLASELVSKSDKSRKNNLSRLGSLRSVPGFSETENIHDAIGITVVVAEALAISDVMKTELDHWQLLDTALKLRVARKSCGLDTFLDDMGESTNSHESFSDDLDDTAMEDAFMDVGVSIISSRSCDSPPNSLEKIDSVGLKRVCHHRNTNIDEESNHGLPEGCFYVSKQQANLIDSVTSTSDGFHIHDSSLVSTDLRCFQSEEKSCNNMNFPEIDEISPLLSLNSSKKVSYTLSIAPEKCCNDRADTEGKESDVEAKEESKDAIETFKDYSVDSQFRSSPSWLNEVIVNGGTFNVEDIQFSHSSESESRAVSSIHIATDLLDLSEPLKHFNSRWYGGWTGMGVEIGKNTSSDDCICTTSIEAANHVDKTLRATSGCSNAGQIINSDIPKNPSKVEIGSLLANTPKVIWKDQNTSLASMSTADSDKDRENEYRVGSAKYDSSHKLDEVGKSLHALKKEEITKPGVHSKTVSAFNDTEVLSGSPGVKSRNNLSLEIDSSSVYPRERFAFSKVSEDNFKECSQELLNCLDERKTINQKRCYTYQDNGNSTKSLHLCNTAENVQGATNHFERNPFINISTMTGQNTEGKSIKVCNTKLEKYGHECALKNKAMAKNGNALIFKGLKLLMLGSSESMKIEYNLLIKEHGGKVFSKIPKACALNMETVHGSSNKTPVAVLVYRARTSGVLFGGVGFVLLQSSWITDSISVNHQLPYDKYLLSFECFKATMSKQKSLTTQRKGCRLFMGMRFMLYGKLGFCSKLGALIKDARGKVFRSIKPLVRKGEAKAFVASAIIVEDTQTVPRHLRICASEYRIPIMSGNWISSSLHQGSLLPFNNKASYGVHFPKKKII